MKVDMSPEAVTRRMEILNQLWELTVELQSAVIVNEKLKDKKNEDEPIENSARQN